MTDNPKGYRHPELLVTPQALSAELAWRRQPAPAGPPASRAVRRGPSARRRAPRPLGPQPDRHRSGAAEGVPVDDRAPVRRAWRQRGAARRRVRRAVRHARRAGVLVSRVLRPPARAGARRRRSAPGRAAGSAAVARDAVARRAERRGRARARDACMATWRTCTTRLGAGDAAMLDTRQRRRVLRHDRCARSAAARFPAPCTSNGRATSRPDGAFKPAAELRAMYGRPA